MARTKADASRKAGGKAPRKAPVLRNTPSTSGGVTKRKSRSSAGSRNAVCKRPVPKWQVSVKDLAWMKPGSSKDQEAEIIYLEPEGSSETACEGAASISVSGDKEYGCANSEKYEESIDEENGIEESIGEEKGMEESTDEENGIEESIDEENGIQDDIKGENGREDEEREIMHPDLKDSDEPMDQKNDEVCPVEDVKGEDVEISENHDEVSTTGDLVKPNEDASLGEKVSIDDTEEKNVGEIAKEFNKNDEKSEISVKDDPKEISDAEKVTVVVKEAEELNKNGENLEVVVKDSKEISGVEIVAEKDEENAGDKED